MSETLTEAWCMLLVRPGKEQDVRDLFRRNNIRAYWPHFQPFIVPRNAPARIMLRSVMPGYVFVLGPFETKFWDVVERVQGTGNVIRKFSGDVLRIRDEDVEVIRKIEMGLNTPTPGKSMHHFKTGHKVRFTDDASHRWPPGKVAGLASDGRLIVEVEIMGRLVPCHVFPHQVEKC